MLLLRRHKSDRGLQVNDLERGDMLLVNGQWRAIDGFDGSDVLVVESGDDVRRRC